MEKDPVEIKTTESNNKNSSSNKNESHNDAETKNKNSSSNKNESNNDAETNNKNSSSNKNESDNDAESNEVDSPKNLTQNEPENVDASSVPTPVKEQSLQNGSPEGRDKNSTENANEIFRTPKKKAIQAKNASTPSDKTENSNSLGVSNKFYIQKTPEKRTMRKSHDEEESQTKLEGSVEEEMISEVEQAKQLMVESENYLRTLERTPVKEVVSQSPQNLSKYSPGTPGRHKRVNLITLDSPKAKKFKAEF